MKILCTASTFNMKLFPKEFEVQFNPYNRKLTEEEVTDLIIKFNPIAIIAGVEPLTNSVLKNAKDLRVISRCGSGTDSVDLTSANELGIKVVNTPDSSTVAVAELTIGLILSILRQIHTSDSSIRNGRWYRPMGHLLSDKTVGIIGCGRIGSCVSRILKSLGCKVLGYDMYLNEHDTIYLTSLDQLLKQSDIITIHLPYSKETHNIIGDQEMSKMKSNSFIVNASRGKLLDEIALYNHLSNGHIKGAAIDCFAEEPYVGNLASLENVLLTAHIGSYAIEARELQEQQSVHNMIYELNKLGLI